MPKRREVSLGEKVDIVLRPETITLGQSYEYRFKGRIEFISYLGSQLVYKINALGQTIVVELQNPKGQINFQPNDSISFSFNEAQLHYV
jgi:ABC-type Fe3+/spermidine/putrescine transport system ATPase subunit